MPGTHDVLFRFRSAGLDEALFNVVRLDGREALSDLYEFRLELTSKDPDIDVGGVLRNNATIEMELGGDLVYVHGIVSTFVQCDRGPEWINYEAVLVPRLYTLGLNQQCQIYLEKDTPTIVRELLTEDGLVENEDFELRLKRTDYPVSEYVVQYQESDLNFARRLLEHAGIFFYFEQSAAKEKLILTDTREAYGVIGGDPVVPFRDARGVNPGGEAVESLRLWQELRPRNVVLKDYNWRAPGVEMQAQGTAAASGRGTFMEYGDHFKSPEEGRALAAIRGEEVACREVVYKGRGGCRSFRAGARFTLIDHFRASSNMEYLLVSVRHQGEQLGVMGTAAAGDPDRPGYLNEFEAIPAGVQFRPARVTPKPRIYGTLNAVIDATGEGDYAELDDLGRYKVRLPFDISNNGAGKASRYMRMAQPYAGEDGGMHFPLLKGTEVILTHVDGDPDRPIISAAVPNVVTSSPVNSQNQTQSMIQTQGQNRIEIEDQEGVRYVHLSTPEETNGQTFMRLGNAGTALTDVIPTDPAPEAPAETPNPTVTVDPLGQSVMLEGSLQFNATVTGAANLQVQWSIESGGAEQGSITEQGLFTAPPALPAATQVTVRATSVANMAKFAEATVVLYAPYVEPVGIYMIPPSIRMEISETQILEAIVVGTANKGVTWSVVEGSAHGSVSAQGIYTPPNTMPNPNSLPNIVTVRATCVADPGKTADCVISLYPEGSRTQGIVSVTVNPRGITLGPNAAQTFTALVTNAGQNQSVTWEVVDGAAGGAINPASGAYTAPAGFASPMLVTIRARSVANTARFGEGQVILFKPATMPVDVYVVAPDDTVQGGDTLPLTAIVTGTNHLVDWTVIGDDATHTKGTISSAGVYTAPAGAGTLDVTVRATSQADPAKHAEYTLHVVPMGTLVEVIVSPGSATVVARKTQSFTAFVRGSLNQAVTWALSGPGSITTHANGGCVYTAPAAALATGTATLTATSAANPARAAGVTIQLLAQGQIATFSWSKITDKLNAMKATGYSEGDITIAANNSVSLYRQNYIQETQAENYSNIEGDSWTRVNGENHQENESNVYNQNNSAVFTMTKLGSLTATFLANVNLIAGFQMTGTVGLAVNLTLLGAWANVVVAGLAVEAFFGAKITVNKGRNFKFFDVDDYEVIDKTSVTAARDGVSLQCGPKSTTTGNWDSVRAGIMEMFSSATAPAYTSAVSMKPDDITLEVKKATGFVEAKIVATSVMKLEEDKVTLGTKSGAIVELTAQAVNITGKSKVTGDFDVDGALSVKGVPVPPPPPPEMPTVPDLQMAVQMAKDLAAFQASFASI